MPQYTFMLGGYILFFGMTETPNFIALNILACDIADRLIMKFAAGSSNIDQELGNSIN